SVVSTGTWVIAMAVGGKAVTLDPALDTLVNVNAFGDAVPSARFMGGREHDLVLNGSAVEASDADMLEVLSQRCMLLPAVVPETGPFAGRQASWHRGEPPQESGQRGAAIGFYLALVTARCLDLIGHQGPIVVEGPFAQNSAYLTMLGVASTSPVVRMHSTTGTSQGAALLAAPRATQQRPTPPHPKPDEHTQQLCLRYAREWNASVSGSGQG
ncbi:MAG: carbohydrate kinase, partial [Pseudomonadota bacterium]